MTGKVVLFAKTPELGKAKTRLQPALGEQGAYQIHQALVEHCLQNLCQDICPPLDLWHTGNSDHIFWQQMRSKYAFGFQQQTGADLGERMLFCAQSYLAPDALDSHDWVIFIGSDCPYITANYIQSAQEALIGGADVVIGPATDGGYVLLGVRQPFAFLFEDMPWGTGEVLDKTLRRCRQNSVSLQLLDALMDVDEPEDLRHFDTFNIAPVVQKSWIDADICVLIHRITGLT